MKHYKKSLGLIYLLQNLPQEYLNLIPIKINFFLIKLSWPMLIAIICFPICLGKQIINCVQFWKASKVLVESDQEERYLKFNKKD